MEIHTMQHVTKAASNYIPSQSTFNAPPDVNWLNAHSIQFGFSRLQCGRDQCRLNVDSMRIQHPVRTGLKVDLHQAWPLRRVNTVQVIHALSGHKILKSWVWFSIYLWLSIILWPERMCVIYCSTPHHLYTTFILYNCLLFNFPSSSFSESN